MPNPLSTIMSGSTLNHNVMTLTLPRTFQEIGELSFGSQSSHTSSDVVKLPLSNATSSSLDSTWHVSASHISLGSVKTFALPLNNSYARFDLQFYTVLPPDILDLFYVAINATFSDAYLLGIISCTARENLPDLVFTLADHHFALTKDEYTRKGYGPDGKEICVVDVLPGYPAAKGEPSAIVLGTRLLSKYRTSFDVHNKEIGCKCFHCFWQCSLGTICTD